eukprot:gene64077-87636_t
MFIQTEATPNPATLKFLPGRTVMQDGTLELRDSEQAERSPLAQRLFGGRALTPDVPAKYLNSPETELFKKRLVLYNGMDARKAARDGKPVVVQPQPDNDWVVVSENTAA